MSKSSRSAGKKAAASTSNKKSTAASTHVRSSARKIVKQYGKALKDLEKY